MTTENTNTTTLFIIWPLAQDAAFRQAYLNRTGEAVQDYPALNNAKNAYLIGSSRAQPDDCVALQGLGLTIQWGYDLSALNWAPNLENV